MASTNNQSIVKGQIFNVSKRYVFTDCRIMNRGSFSVVSQTFDTLTQQKIAIKLIRYANEEWEGRCILREIRLMKLLKHHPNVRDNYF